MLFKNITVVDETFTAREGMYLQTEGNKITYLSSTPLENYTGEIFDGKNKIAMPGFFNIHCHAPMALVRGFGEGLPLHRWLTEKMFPFEALLTQEDIYWGALLGIAEMISSGAVSFSDMYMEMEGMCRAVDQSGMKANLSQGNGAGLDGETHFKGVRGWYGTQAMLQYIQSCGHDRIRADVSVHAEYTSNPVLVREVAEFAKENSLRMHLHISETKAEHEACKERRGGKTPTAWFASLGALDVPATVAHCVWVEPQDSIILAEKGATVAHCPSSNLKLGSGIAPIGEMLKAGVKVGVGTDGAASNNNLNMLEEVNLASILQKGAQGNPLVMGPAQMLELSCKNGALSQGRQGCGAIQVGNRADIVVYDLDKPHLQPVFDVLSNILYSAQSSDIVMNMIDGQVVYQQGEFKTIDIEKVKFHAGRIAAEKLEQLSK